MQIQGLQKQLRDFAAARDWQPYHSPKNLAMALMVEAAELLELFQWLTTEQSHTLTREASDKEKVADEIADVFLYLLQIADKTNIELEQAVQNKLRKNAKKYPTQLQQAQAAQPKVHVLVDWENVQPDAEALKSLIADSSDVWLFHSPGFVFKPQKLAAYHALYGAERVTQVARTGEGKNALDFQLSYYAGYLMAKQPDARFVVLSNDKGYDPMLAHACTLEFKAERSAYVKTTSLEMPAEPTPGVTPVLAPVKGQSVESVHQQAAQVVFQKRKSIAAPTLPSPVAAAKKKANKPKAKSKKCEGAVPANSKALSIAPSNTKAGIKKNLANITRQVGAALRKLAHDKPVTRDGLLQVIHKKTPTNLAHAVTANQVLAVLQSQQVIKISKSAQVSYPHQGRSIPLKQVKPKTTVKKKEPLQGAHFKAVAVPA